MQVWTSLRLSLLTEFVFAADTEGPTFLAVTVLSYQIGNFLLVSSWPFCFYHISYIYSCCTSQFMPKYPRFVVFEVPTKNCLVLPNLGLETGQLTFAENKTFSSQLISVCFLFHLACFKYLHSVKNLKIVTFDTKVSAKVIKIFISDLSK